MPIELLTLRLIHVLGGIFWVGAGLYNTFFLVPAMSKLGPAAGPFMAELQRRKLFTVMPTVAVLTALTGIRLLWIVSGGFAISYLKSPSGAGFTIAGASAILAFLLGMVWSRPAQMKLGAAAAALASAPEGERPALAANVDRLRKSAGLATAVPTGLLLLAAVGMAISRYL